jgi:hypothetical protein
MTYWGLLSVIILQIVISNELRNLREEQEGKLNRRHYLRNYKARITETVNLLTGNRGPLWSRRYDAQVVLDDAAASDRLGYCLDNPNAVDRVASAHISLGGSNRFIATGHVESLVQIAGAAGRARGFGDAYAYHLLATGCCNAAQKAKIVLEAKIRSKNLAALSVAVEAARGRCADLQGKPAGFNLNSVLFAYGELCDELLQRYDRGT